MTSIASRHLALPLPWIIVLMVFAGVFAFWVVTYAIPKFLTGKTIFSDKAAWQNGAWRRRAKRTEGD